MPLKFPAQVSNIAEYKKLVQADARNLAATGAKFHYFAKYTFVDKTTSPVILFGVIDTTLFSTISKNGAGPATGQATVNDADEIVLEVASGTVAYGGLSKSLKACGVIRQLHIPAGSEEAETSGEEGGSSSPKFTPGNTQQGSGRPAVPPRGAQGGVSMGATRPVPPAPQQRPTAPNPGSQPGTNAPAPTAGARPAGVQPQAQGAPQTGGRPLPQTPPQRAAGSTPGGATGQQEQAAKPVPPVRPAPTEGSSSTAPNPAGQAGAGSAAPKDRPLMGSRGASAPGAAPSNPVQPPPGTAPGGNRPTPPPQGSKPAQGGNPGWQAASQRSGQSAQGGAVPAGTSTPGQGSSQPKQQATPPPHGKKIFDERYNDLKARYEGNPNKGNFKLLYDDMIAKARAADFPAALVAANKLDATMSKADFSAKKRRKQGKRAARLSETFDAVKRSYFKPGTSDIIAREKLDAGKHFKAFLDAQRAFETARDEQSLRALEAQAQAYIAHYVQDYGPKDKQKPESLKKLGHCQTALKAARHYRLAFEQDKLGNPPWNEEQEAKASELYSELLFEQEDGKTAKPNADAGVIGSWWVEKTVFDEEDEAEPDEGSSTSQPPKREETKTFIFKPFDTEERVSGYPKGGSAAREVMGKAVGDQLQAAMGLNFAVPETAVITVDNSKLADEHGEVGAAGPRVGSVQHFAKSDGQLGKMLHKDPTLGAKIPDDEVQKMAVLDLVQLNLDRHAGNFMVGDAGGQPRLLPIDHGLVLPSRDGLRARRFKLGAPHNALGEMPAANKKMAPELVEKIKQIDPDEVVAGMKRAFAALQKQHPDAANASRISDENFALVKRSIQFLKKAAGELTLAELQDAYGAFMEKIFETADNQRDTAFDEVIRDTKARTPHLQELERLSSADPKFAQNLRALGWGVDFGGGSLEGWKKMNPEKVVKIYKNKIENPAARREANDLRAKLHNADPKELQSPPGLDQELRTLRRVLENRQTAKAEGYGLENADNEAGYMAELYESLGGDNQVRQVASQAADFGVKERFALLAKGRIDALGGQKELENIKGRYPGTDIDTPYRQVKALEAWRDYQQMGGDAEYSRLGADHDNESVVNRVMEMNDLKTISAIN